MLSSLFNWLDSHPDIYWWVVLVPTLAFLGAVVAGLWTTRDNNSRRGEWIFVGLLVAFVAAWRWPFTLEAQEFNPDESQLISGAITLAHDPVFWRSVDGTTSGPLNFYTLLPLRWLGLPLDYFTARWAALALVCGALIATYRLFRTHAPAGAARLAVLPAVLFFATAYDNDFVHYSSEHVSLLIVALAAYWLMGASRTLAKDRRSWLIGSFVAGLLPWAKIQTAPIALVLGGIALYRVVSDERCTTPQKWRWVAWTILALGAPSVLLVIAVALTGQFEHLVQNYLLQNLVYAGGGTTLQDTIQTLAEASKRTAVYPTFLAAIAVSVTLSIAVLVKSKRRPHWFAVAGGLLAVSAVFCVLTPRRPFTHYLLLSIVPLTWWSGALIADAWAGLRRRRLFACAILVAAGLFPLVIRAIHPVPESFGKLEESWRRPRSVSGNVIRAYADSQESLGVWGWRTDVYVETGLRQASRDPHTVWAITNSPRRAYYRSRYLDDLKQSRPMFFVDAVGEGSLYYKDRAKDGHESFPELRDYIQQNYFLLLDQGVERTYVRKDKWSGAIGPLSPATLQRFLAQSRQTGDIDAAEPESTSPPNLSGWDIDGQGSKSLLPGSSIMWSLSGNERGVVLRYGFHPRSYTEGTTNGADFIVELWHGDDPARPVFQRHLEPLTNKSHRGTLTSRVMLPPVQAGTKLVVRTATGPSSDASWDWVYLGLMKWMKADGFLAQQFPGFQRLPDRAEADQSYLMNNGRVHILLVNGPAALTYILDGNERRLDFAFGFEPEKPGQYPPNYDATYRIELHHGSDPVRVCFERRLQPAQNPSDRERQWAKVTLPTISPGDQLIVRIEEPATASAQRTYLSDFSLITK